MKRAILKRHEVADRIRAYIAECGLAPGTRLPSEKELASLFSMSRPCIRVGLIALHLAGEIDIQPGEASYVRKPDELLGGFCLGIGPLEILKARITIETRLAEEAAIAATCEDIAQLGHLVDAMKIASSRTILQSLSRSFHLLLASIAGQVVVGQVIGSLIDKMSANRTEESRTLSRGSLFEAEIAEHEAIFVAISRRDGRQAAIRMRSHLISIEERLKQIDNHHSGTQYFHPLNHSTMTSSSLRTS